MWGNHVDGRGHQAARCPGELPVQAPFIYGTPRRESSELFETSVDRPGKEEGSAMQAKDVLKRVPLAAAVSVAMLLGWGPMTASGADPTTPIRNWPTKGEGIFTRISAKPIRRCFANFWAQASDKSAGYAVCHSRFERQET